MVDERLLARSLGLQLSPRRRLWLSYDNDDDDAGDDEEEEEEGGGGSVIMKHGEDAASGVDYDVDGRGNDDADDCMESICHTHLRWSHQKQLLWTQLQASFGSQPASRTCRGCASCDGNLKAAILLDKSRPDGSSY